MCVSKGVPGCLLCVSVNVASRLHAEKISSEYLNHRNLLMSKMDRLDWEGSFRSFKLINLFLLSQYSYTDISLKRGVSWVIPSALQKAYPDVYCV